MRWRHRQHEPMGTAGGIKLTSTFADEAILPHTGADDPYTSGTATYSDDSEYMAVFTHRVVSHEQVTTESLVVKVTRKASHQTFNVVAVIHELCRTYSMMARDTAKNKDGLPLLTTPIRVPSDCPAMTNKEHPTKDAVLPACTQHKSCIDRRDEDIQQLPPGTGHSGSDDGG